MDNDIARWILEFLIRQSLDNRTLSALLRILPLSDDDSRFKKGLLLKTIELEIANGSISEKILGWLEFIEEFDYKERKEVTAAMKAAYCAVAVNCTVKFLYENEKDKYLDAAKRIWLDRVCHMEDSVNVGLFSEELKKWRVEIVATLHDPSYCDNILPRSKGIDAVHAVRVYLEEAKGIMGPSFLELLAETLSEDTLKEVLGMGNKATYGVNARPKRKHIAVKKSRRSILTSRGIKIVDTDELGIGISYNKYGCLSTPEVNKLKEALQSSSLELQAAVKDPLPDALHLAENVISSMSKKHIDHELLIDNNNNANEPGRSSLDKGFSADQTDGSNIGNESCRNQKNDPKPRPYNQKNNDPKPSLLSRNSTAHTYEWDDSIDRVPEGSPDDSSRAHLPSPKKAIVSPLKKYDTKPLRRRRKFWSNLEEDTLRNGVQKYGIGNWKLILRIYKDIFDERTEVDLKDKWRNLTRG